MSNDVPIDQIVRRAIINEDELAISALTHIFDEVRRGTGAASAAPAPGTIPLADVQRIADDRHAFLSAVDQNKRDFPDLWEDERLHAKLQKADHHIAQTEPNLPYAERLHRAGVAVRAWRDQNWDADEHLRHSVIARMHKTRDQARQANRMGPSLGDEMEPTELDYETPYRPDAEAIERSEVIAEMKAGRQATVLNEGD